MRGRVVDPWTSRLATALACVVALLLGAAHPEGPRASAPQELAAYALPGGELPYLCGTPAREPSAPDDHGHAACLAACLATVPAALPGAGPEPPPARGAYRSRLPGQAADARPRTRWTASRARAPPLV